LIAALAKIPADCGLVETETLGDLFASTQPKQVIQAGKDIYFNQGVDKDK
jgi:hypothetical protein